MKIGNLLKDALKTEVNYFTCQIEIEGSEKDTDLLLRDVVLLINKRIEENNGNIEFLFPDNNSIHAFWFNKVIRLKADKAVSTGLKIINEISSIKEVKLTIAIATGEAIVSTKMALALGMVGNLAIEMIPIGQKNKYKMIICPNTYKSLKKKLTIFQRVELDSHEFYVVH